MWFKIELSIYTIFILIGCYLFWDNYEYIMQPVEAIKSQVKTDERTPVSQNSGINLDSFIEQTLLEENSKKK